MMKPNELITDCQIICPSCNQAGQRITCTSGSKTEVIFYHPKRVSRTVCNVVNSDCETSADLSEAAGELPGLER